jgi:hypothetical protein
MIFNSTPHLATSLFHKITKTWLGIAFIGQAFFAVYIILLNGKNGIAGNWDQWNNATPQGYSPGDQTGNVIFGIHVALAAIVTIGGPLQLIPSVRKNYQNSIESMVVFML